MMVILYAGRATDDTAYRESARRHISNIACGECDKLFQRQHVERSSRIVTDTDDRFLPTSASTVDTICQFWLN